MSLQRARIVLDITFDNETNDHPANWNWVELLDLGGEEDVVVVEGN